MDRADRSATARGAWMLVAATAIAWAGFFVHNVADLPGQTILSPESLYPTLITGLFLAVALVPQTRRVGVWLLLAWTVLHLIGAILTVLPLPFLPFEPEQSAKHYVFHVIYAVSQLPLLWVTIAWLVRRRRRPRH